MASMRGSPQVDGGTGTNCERPIGTTHCDHFAGTPVRDGYEALARLMETWTHDDPVDCTSYASLD